MSPGAQINPAGDNIESRTTHRDEEVKRENRIALTDSIPGPTPQMLLTASPGEFDRVRF
jgi:hypothetical protein